MSNTHEDTSGEWILRAYCGETTVGCMKLFQHDVDEEVVDEYAVSNIAFQYDEISGWSMYVLLAEKRHESSNGAKTIYKYNT